MAPTKERYIGFKPETSYSADREERIKRNFDLGITRMLKFFSNLTPRDPARIDRILELLAVIWKRHPDFRFFQLLEAIFGCPKMRKQCFFAQEDDITEKRMKLAVDIGFVNAREHKLGEQSD